MHAIRNLHIADYEALIALMQTSPGVRLRDADSQEATARYLERNPGLSFVAVAGDKLLGCIMAGHDGRRAYLQHLLVATAFRRQGIARELLAHTLRALQAQGIHKSHIDVLIGNETGAAFWQASGWVLRTDIHRYSIVMDGGENA
jgi:ribosomal protein S18 acetylase RimI-like enzyme